jgi:hypothetical protein
MPFCPKCRYEYQAGIAKCPDCDETLVSSLPDETETPDEPLKEYKDWIHLARLTSYQSAVMIVETLRDKAIPVVVNSGAGHFGITGQMGPSSFRPIDGAYSIMVPREYIIDADREAETLLGDEWINARLVDLG